MDRYIVIITIGALALAGTASAEQGQVSIGSLLNPFGFLVLAIKPNLRQHPSTPFGAIMAGSFVLTTIGYLGAAWYVARAAVLAP